MSLENRSEYFALSRCPITAEAEQSMESASHVVTKEHYTDHWDRGVYGCARCGHALYDNTTKFVGPCLWPSFREGVADETAAKEKSREQMMQRQALASAVAPRESGAQKPTTE